jgi:phospholipase A-2-activating protein
MLPTTTVWSVAVGPTGDIASACSSGVTYVHSRDTARFADASLVEQYEKELSSFSIASNQVGDLNKDKLPGPEALESSGTKEGQILMVKRENIVEAHQWSSHEEKWVKVGNVVDAIGNNRKKMHEGKEYDYVFDIDVGTGGMLKLPYNTTGIVYQI